MVYPVALSEGVASLLPDVGRAAVVWTIDLDAEGATVAVDVRRARVCSRAKLNYAERGARRGHAAARSPRQRQRWRGAASARGSIALDDPPVFARCQGELPLGERVRVRLMTADPKQRKVLFERVWGRATAASGARPGRSATPDCARPPTRGRQGRRSSRSIRPSRPAGAT